MTTTPEFFDGSMSARSMRLRADRRAIRLSLQQDGLPLADVLEDPPACLDGVPLYELISWRRGWAHVTIKRIGAAAIKDDINLFVLVGGASQRTLRWVACWDHESARYPPPRVAA